MGNTMKNSAGKVIKTVITALLLLLLVVNLTLAILQNRSGVDYFENVPVAVLQVTGGSMEPELHNGDAILIRQIPFQQLQVGDVIVFSRGEQLITHKIIARGETLVTTQGTANPLPDDPVTETEYRAKVICRIPGLGAIWSAYENGPMFLLWVVILVLLLFGTDIFPSVYDLIVKTKEKKK